MVLYKVNPIRLIKTKSLCTFLSLLSVLFFVSCEREKHWNAQITAPLFRANLSLSDLGNDSLTIEETDSSYNLIYQVEYSIDSVASYLTVPDTVDKVRITLDKLILADKNYADTITLRQIYPAAGAYHGQTVFLPGQNIDNPGGEQEIDVSKEFFQTAKFVKGFLDITIHNDLPVYVDEIVYVLRNKKDLTVIAQDTFTNIPPFSSSTRSIDLSGKTVDGVLLATVIHMITRESEGDVLIDADKGLRLELSVHDLEPEYATAIFPEQTLVNDTQEVIYNFGGPLITEIQAKSGFVKMKISSTIEEEIIIDYTFPHSGAGGNYANPFHKVYNVPPAKPGETQVIEGVFPLDGYVMQYKGKDPNSPPFWNAVYSKLTAKTVYSGQVRDLSLNDYVEIEFGLIDIVPRFATGDFGVKSYTIDDSLDIPIFEKINGEVDLADFKFYFNIENALGIGAVAKINSLRAENTSSGKSVTLDCQSIIGKEINISKAHNPPLIPSTTTTEFTKYSCDNLIDFVEILPNKIYANISMNTLPSDSGNVADFVLDQSYIKGHVNFTIPATFSANNLTLSQTGKFNINAVSNQENITSGTFRLDVENDFPYDFKVVLDFLDESGTSLLTLFENQLIQAASIDMSNYHSVGPRKTSLLAKINETQMDMIRDTKQIRITAVIDSPNDVQTPILNTYLLKTQLVADFIYEAGN
ncbi:MAG: hypothetical protein H6607_08690 [Flavobacteriales bacterium]|nr:hypothetical protein [Flavobacteriales bacterium]